MESGLGALVGTIYMQFIEALNFGHQQKMCMAVVDECLYIACIYLILLLA